MVPLELQAAPPRDLSSAGALLSKKAPKLRDQIIGFVLIPLGFVLFAWIKYGIGSPGDLTLAACLGLGIDAFIGLFALAFSVQRKRAALLFRDGIATTGIVRQIQTPGDGSSAAYGLLQIEYQDAAGRTHIGRFTTMGAKKDMDASAGASVPILYLPSDPRLCGFYTPGMGMVPGRAPA
jgi:hypothetical protein